jgi:hypothetical protein
MHWTRSDRLPTLLGEHLVAGGQQAGGCWRVVKQMEHWHCDQPCHQQSVLGSQACRGDRMLWVKLQSGCDAKEFDCLRPWRSVPTEMSSNGNRQRRHEA